MILLRKGRALAAAASWMLTAWLLCACATPHAGTALETRTAASETLGEATQATPGVPPRDDTMSLWSEEVAFGDLFSDPKARRAGDILTIKIVESSSASNSADTSTDRDSSLSAGVDQLFGVHPSTLNLQNLSVSGGMASEFEGSGSTSRSGSLEAFITVQVTDVQPNGNLKIVGSREIMVNNEKQIMTIYGVVRPRDISDDNVVLSTFVADARIAYSGAGIIDDRQRPGWLANVLNTVWPF